ncbi:MAG: hypothetical protein PHD82_04870 [Candidatus Riflebacteria bacterium]|nr:hypothetical protein [Candidatus Riflebacteria bacterium]
MEDKNSKRLESLAIELEKRRQQHKEGGSHSRKMRRWLRRFLMFAAFCFFILASVFFVNFFRLNSDLIEGHIKQGIIPNLTRGRFTLQMGSISGDLLHGVNLDNVLVQNPHFKTSATLLTVPRVSMKYSLLDILFGRLVLQKLVVENPILTISRNEKSRGIWDFSDDLLKAVVPAVEADEETVWQKREKAQVLADQYLEDIQVKNLSILVPAPDKLIKDEFVARLVRLPKSTFQINGINLSLKKHASKAFNSHLLKIFLADKRDWLMFQVTKMKSNGNFTVGFDALGQSFTFAVENLGEAGRKINLFDGRRRDRLNLEWVWARERVSLPEKIRGLTGILQIDQLKDLTSGLLSTENDLSGSLLLKVSCAAGKPLYDAHASLNLASMSVNIPFVPVVKNLAADLDIFDRRASLQNLSVDIASITSSHEGYVDFANEAAISASLDSLVANEKLAAAASYTRLEPGVHQFAARVDRNSGRAEISFNRRLVGKEIRYSDFNFVAGLIASGSAADILPLKLLPAELVKKMQEYLARVDILGPLAISTAFASLDDWQTSAVEIDLNGARIVSRISAKDYVTLGGKALLDAGSLRLDGFSADIDNLRFDATGSAVIVASSPFVKDFSLRAQAKIEDDKNFSITSERLQSSIGLKARPDFDSIELTGKNIATIEVDADKGVLLETGFDKLNFVRRGKVLWADHCQVSADISWQGGDFLNGVGLAKGDASLEFFGVPLELKARLDVAARKLDNLSFTGGGSNFARLIEALKTQPEGRDFFKKYPLGVTGSFNFAMLAAGTLACPNLDGWLKFPVLNVSMSGMSARLPFNVQLKTLDNVYHAGLKAGEASIKVKDVTFDLGKTDAELVISGLNASSGTTLGVKANSEVFGAGLNASGTVKLSEKSFDNFKLAVRSGKIETLAAEISRIGRFTMPFSLSGKFESEASLNGPFASPSSRGYVDVGLLNIDMPISTGRAKTVIAAKKITGRLNFDKRGDRLFAVDLKQITGSILDSVIKISGKARLENLRKGFKPVLEGLTAELSGLEMKKLFDFIASGLLPKAVSDVFTVESGIVQGKFALSGTPQKIIASGSASLSEGSIKIPVLKDSVKKLKADFSFEGRSDSGFARIGVSDLAGSFGRSDFVVSSGWLEDPLKSGKIGLSGQFGKVYPADLLAMLGGMALSAVSFPQEGWLDGSLEISGTFARPLIEANVQSTEMKIQYNSGQGVFSVPVGKNTLHLNLNPESGLAEVKKCDLELLGGRLALNKASGRFLPGRPFILSLDGLVEGIDFSSLQINNAEALRGYLGGTFKAEWNEHGARDAVFNLGFKDIYVPSLPIIDPQTLAKAGADFIEKPDFRVGQLNFYVTTEEDDELKGKLLIADGLFAGPHLRFELGNSEFNPQAMQLDAKLMINPQSLRQSDIGRKLKKWTVTIQDEKTGVPYVDLSVGGTWDKPELIARALKKKAEKRVKRNFIGRIFGGHRPHKASVEELMQWFPGWKKGL